MRTAAFAFLTFFWAFLIAASPPLSFAFFSRFFAEPDEVRRLAHRIKGAARIVGANRLDTLAQRLEDAAATGATADQLAPLAAPLRDAVADCEAAAAAG